MIGPGYLAIVWHSRTGAARAMAQAAADGGLAAARDERPAEAERSVRLVHASAVEPDMLMGAAGYLFICPENLGSMSGIMKDMFDRVYYPLLGHIAGRPYATAIAAGSDGRGAEAQIDRIVTGWRLRRVVEPLIVGLDAQTPAAILAAKTVPERALTKCRELGTTLMSGIALGIF